MTEPSRARRGLNLLLERYPHFDVVRVDHQRGGPWVLVDLGQPSDGQADPTLEAFAVHPFAIWKQTGSVYGMDEFGAVLDDPLLTLDDEPVTVDDAP
jgi:hypothetical protein